MRLLIIILLCTATVGCGSVSSRTEREIALLRAEILDLGDQYGDLKSRHRRALADLSECKGEPVSDYFPETGAFYQDTGEPYYPEGQIIGSGFVHTGSPDCCADCSRRYSGYGSEIIDHGPTILPSETPINLSPQETPNRQPVIEPIATPFEETGRAPINSGDSSRSDLNRRINSHALRKNIASRWAQRAKSAVSSQIKDATPAFNPNESQWTQRRNERLPLEPADIVVTDGNSADKSGTSPWRVASTTKSGPISDVPIDDRYLDDPAMDSGNSTSSVKQIFIDPENSFASDYNDDGGDDGIRLLIQPLDAQGRIVNRGAGLVISVIDAKEVGEAQRIGLWRFEPYQVEGFVSYERGQHGLLVDLPWQRRAPNNKKLVVFVRYITESGDKLETSLDVEINPPSHTDDIQMLDPMAKTRKSRTEVSPANNSANLPKWRPVR